MVSLHTVTILWFCSGSRFNWTNHFNILLSQQQPQSEGSDAYVGFDEFYHHGRRWSNSGPTGLHSYQPYSCTQGLFLDQNIFKVIQNIPRNWKWLLSSVQKDNFPSAISWQCYLFHMLAPLRYSSDSVSYNN